MVSLSVGILLATALLHSLPEAFNMEGTNPQLLFATLLAGLLGYCVTTIITKEMVITIIMDMMRKMQGVADG